MIRVRVLGEAKLARKLAAVEPALRAAFRREVKIAALNIERGAKQRAPVDTGRLRNSIAHEVTADGMNASIGSNVEYAPFQEFGTRTMRAQPFLFPAFEEERPRFMDRVKRALSKAAGEVATR